MYSLPRVDDNLDSLGEARYFSSLDLASGYWQVELDEDARKKSAFTTYNGLFEFTRMAFGLCNAPATFQRIMQRVLAGLEWQSCFVYIDDILAASKTFEEHPCPLDATGVRRFLGLASYYRRFVPSFSVIAAPLNALTKKNAVFQWTSECDRAFEELKHSLTTTPVLGYPRFGPGRSFILETDASTVGLGAVLSQTQDDGTIHPIAYASRSVDKHEKNYGISELETLRLVWAVRYFRSYLLGHPCVVYTDHIACLSILNTARPSGKLARWQEMDLTIKHKSGKKNTNADALSRCPADVRPEESWISSIEADLFTDDDSSDFYSPFDSCDDEDPVGDDSSCLPDPEKLRECQVMDPEMSEMMSSSRSLEVSCIMRILQRSLTVGAL